MNFAIDDDVLALAATIADFFERRGDARAIASAAATGPAADRARWSALCELGLPALRVAEPLGIGAGVLEATSVAERLGAVLLPEPMTASIVLARVWHDHGGSVRLMEDLLDGTRVVSFAVFDRVQLSRAATATGQIRVFDGDICDFVAVPAITDAAQPAVLILDRRQLRDGTQRTDMDPTRPMVCCDVDGVRPVEVLPLDDAALAEAVREAAVLTSSELVGAMQAVLTATIDYARQREQFGRSIGSFQAVKHRLADMNVAVEQARAATQFAAIGCAHRSDSAPADVAAAARWVPRAAIDLFDTAIHLHGAMGYSWEMNLHLHLRRALVTREQLNSAPAP